MKLGILIFTEPFLWIVVYIQSYENCWFFFLVELNLLREYSIKTLCGTKEELPFLTPDEYLMGIQDEGPIMQVRVPVEIIRGMSQYKCTLIWYTVDI